MKEQTKKQLIRIGVLLGLLLLFAFFYSLRDVLWPFVIAFFIAYILNPWVNFFQRRGWSRTVSAFVVFGLIVVLIGLVGLLIVPQVMHEVGLVASRLPQYSEVIKTRLAPWIMDLRQSHPDIAAQIEEYWRNNAKEKIPQLLHPFLNALGKMFSGVASFIVALLNIFLIPVLAFYLLADFPELKNEFYNLIPPRNIARLRGRLEEMDEALGQYLRGQLSVSLALGMIYTAGLLILQVPLAIPIGLLSGLANMVPYLGIVLGIISSCLLSFVDNQDWHRLVWIVVLYAFAQLNEGTWMGPLLVGKRTGLHPVVVMLSLVIGGTLFGFMGMILAVPFVAVASVMLKSFHESYLGSVWYKDHIKMETAVVVVDVPADVPVEVKEVE